MKHHPPAKNSCGICILAGGQSQRMGRDKSSLRLGRRTLLGHVRATAASLGWPTRLIRDDAVDRCGPLGGVYTALLTTRSEAEIFLACDMPFVSEPLLRTLADISLRQGQAVCVTTQGQAGFPFVLARAHRKTVSNQLAKKDFSLQGLFRAVAAHHYPLPHTRAWELWNVNTPQDWQYARTLMRSKKL